MGHTCSAAAQPQFVKSTYPVALGMHQMLVFFEWNFFLSNDRISCASVHLHVCHLFSSKTGQWFLVVSFDLASPTDSLALFSQSTRFAGLFRLEIRTQKIQVGSWLDLSNCPNTFALAYIYFRILNISTTRYTECGAIDFQARLPHHWLPGTSLIHSRQPHCMILAPTRSRGTEAIHMGHKLAQKTILTVSSHTDWRKKWL